jgi:hypothetical protein
VSSRRKRKDGNTTFPVEPRWVKVLAWTAPVVTAVARRWPVGLLLGVALVALWRVDRAGTPVEGTAQVREIHPEVSRNKAFRYDRSTTRVLLDGQDVEVTGLYPDVDRLHLTWSRGLLTGRLYIHSVREQRRDPDEWTADQQRMQAREAAFDAVVRKRLQEAQTQSPPDTPVVHVPFTP